MTQEDTIALGSQILKVALEFEQLVVSGLRQEVALSRLRRQRKEYNPEVVTALENFQRDDVQKVVKTVTMKNLSIGMVVDEDIRAKNGLLLVSNGQEVTHPVLARLRNFSRRIGVVEPFRVLAPPQESGQNIAED